MTDTALQSNPTAGPQVLYMAMELSNTAWRLRFGAGRIRQRDAVVAAGDAQSLEREIGTAKRKLGLSASAPVMSCYEAGRDGFWIHRLLGQLGIENLVVDSSCIEVNRKARRAKTDKVDVGKLLVLLMRHGSGERDVWRTVRVPTVEEEDARRVHRGLDRLVKERTGHSNRITSLLVTQGVRVTVKRGLEKLLDKIRLWNGSLLPPWLKQELQLEYERWALVDEQIKGIRAQQRKAMKAEPECTEKCTTLNKAVRLAELRGVGERSAWPLAHEFFYRVFENRRQVGAAAGLTGTPFASGAITRELGISKSGNKRVRRLMVELSWCWLRFQPDSEISEWFGRFALGGKRTRRIGIVAVARKLLIALWRYVEQGVMPAGAVLKSDHERLVQAA